MIKEISQKSFDQIKLSIKFLKKAAKTDPEDFELDNLPGKLEEKAEDVLPYQETLGEFMNDNQDLLCAGNLNISYGDSEILAYTRGQDVADPSDEPLDYSELADRLTKLAKLGRKGIYKLEIRNNKLESKIQSLKNKMNVIA